MISCIRMKVRHSIRAMIHCLLSMVVFYSLSHSFALRAIYSGFMVWPNTLNVLFELNDGSKKRWWKQQEDTIKSNLLHTRSFIHSFIHPRTKGIHLCVFLFTHSLDSTSFLLISCSNKFLLSTHTVFIRLLSTFQCVTMLLRSVHVKTKPSRCAIE